MKHEYEISLCENCLRREGIKATLKSGCDLCGGLLQNLSIVAARIVDKLKEFEYNTFLIGASVAPTLLDREDELRSRFKIKGKESLKSEITRLLTERISKTTGKRPDYARPDVTVLITTYDQSISIVPRSIWLCARYTKSTRGIPQRASACKTCSGLGCAECGYRGMLGMSIQSVASDFFCKEFNAESCNFIWLGSEDENSLVGGSGRPFYIEVVRPKKRFEGRGLSHLSARMVFKSKDLKLFGVQRLRNRMSDIPQIEVRCKIYLRNGNMNHEVKLQGHDIERNFSNHVVNVRLSRKFRIVQRLIRSIKIESEGNERAVILFDCDGGIPIKKLVNGQDSAVEPNLSKFIAPFHLDEEKPFDILEVRLKETQMKVDRRAKQRVQSLGALESRTSA